MECTFVGRGLAMGDGDSLSIAAQLEKLQSMRANGTLSEAEFQNLKSALVAKTTSKVGGISAGVIGAVVAIALVIAVVMFAMPRHGADRATQTAAQPPAARPLAQPATPVAPQSDASNAPVDQAANGPANPPAAAEPPPLFQTSFDCTQARQLALRLICTNPNLAAQDLQLAALYRRARANAIDPSQLSDQQREWLAARDSCGSIGCLATVYAQRRRELAQWITN